NTRGLAEVGDLRSMVGSGVVHDQNVASSQLGEQPDAEPANEALAVRSGKHGAESDPSPDPDGSDERQVLAPIHRNTLLVHASAFHPRVAAGHRTVEASLVEKHEPVYRDLRDLAKKRLPFQDDVGAERLQRPAAFFLTTYPKRWSARFMLETCTRDRPRRPLLNCAVSSPAFASPSAPSSASTSLSAIREWFPPPLRVGDRSPVRRDCRNQR